MDANYEIYSAPEDEIPAEDKARLDGYLKGREEAAKLLEEVKAEALAAKIREMEAARDAE